MAPSHRCLGAGSTVPRVKLGLLSIGEMRALEQECPNLWARFKSSAQIGRYSVGVGATKVWRFYVSATSATNVALVWHQKGGLTRSLDDLGIMHLRCTSIAIPHKPQSSILSSQSSLYHKVWYIYVCTTCTTNVVQVWYTKGTSHDKVPPRFELGSPDSKSRVLTITP